MKKEDLKVGYVLEVEDLDGKGFVMVLPNEDGTIGVSGDLTWFYLDSLDDNLEYNTCKVLRVYGHTSNRDSHKLSSKGRELLWDRNPPKKLTMSEIEAILGYKFEIVE